MADKVQAVLERMSIELNLLLKNKVFSRAEIRSIVRRRTHFEYRIARNRPDRLDFLRYLKFEARLETLRRSRLGGLAATATTSKHVLDSPYIANGGVRHINFIFERALLKFPGDSELWASYIEFCVKSSRTNFEHDPKAIRVGKALGRALQLHPRDIRLWTFAARWELDHNANAQNARTVLQRAIRVNPKEPELFLEYAKTELLAAERVEAAIGKSSKHDKDSKSKTTTPIAPATATKVKDAAAPVEEEEEEEEDDDLVMELESQKEPEGDEEEGDDTTAELAKTPGEASKTSKA